MEAGTNFVSNSLMPRATSMRQAFDRFHFSYLEPLHIDTDLEANVTLEEETTITLTDNRGGVVTFNGIFQQRLRTKLHFAIR